MLYSCTRMATVGVKGFTEHAGAKILGVPLYSDLSYTVFD